MRAASPIARKRWAPAVLPIALAFVLLAGCNGLGAGGTTSSQTAATTPSPAPAGTPFSCSVLAGPSGQAPSEEDFQVHVGDQVTVRFTMMPTDAGAPPESRVESVSLRFGEAFEKVAGTEHAPGPLTSQGLTLELQLKATTTGLAPLNGEFHWAGAEKPFPCADLAVTVVA